MLSPKEFRIIGTLIHLFSTFFGVTANIVLIFLLFKTNVNELRRYRRIILQFAIFDITNSIILFCVAPVLVLIEGVEFFFQGSFFRTAPYSINQAGILIWLFFHFFSLSVVPIQFAYRYFLLSRNILVKNKTYASLFIFPVVFSSIYLMLSYFTSYENVDFSDETVETLKLFLETDNPRDMVIITIGQHAILDVLISNSAGLVIAIISYLVIFYYGYKINSFLKNYSNSFSPKTTQMHQSLNKVLFIQALTPLIFLILPTMITLICSFAKQTTSPNFVLSMIVIAFPPFINAAFTLLTLKPLRLKMFKIFCKRKNPGQITLQQHFFTVFQTSSSNRRTTF